ncbi:MAG: hypothetical protein WDA08_11140 [Weeksellaceae bacterium]|nr:hypothetical protein [Acholeplasmataceae bacterium]
MKKIITLSLLFVLLGSSTHGQNITVVFNRNLFIQLNKNHIMRTISNEQIKNSTEKQNELYNSVKTKMAAIIAVHDFLYTNLKNINSLINDGKQAYYMADYLIKIYSELNNLITLTIEKPEFAAIKYEYYLEIYDQYLALQTEVETQILKVDEKYLMDPKLRFDLIQNTMSKLRNLYFSLLGTTSYLKWSDDRNKLITDFPILGDYYIIDRAIIQNIMNNLNHLF